MVGGEDRFQGTKEGGWRLIWGMVVLYIYTYISTSHQGTSGCVQYLLCVLCTPKRGGTTNRVEGEEEVKEASGPTHPSHAIRIIG